MKNVEETLKVYSVFEEYFNKGTVKNLGFSNFYSIKFLEFVYDSVQIKPKFLQNRFYKQTNYDKEIRKFCEKNGIVYQSFWSLTANPHILRDVDFVKISGKYGLTPEQMFFKFLVQLGICPLTGTTSEKHMLEDLEIFKGEEAIGKEDIDYINTFLY